MSREDAVQAAVEASAWPCLWCREDVEAPYDCRCKGSREAREAPGWMYAMAAHAYDAGVEAAAEVVEKWGEGNPSAVNADWASEDIAAAIRDLKGA